jgi:Zn-dependent protease
VCAQPAPGTEAPGRTGPRITPIQWVGLAVLLLLVLNAVGLLQLDNPNAMLGMLSAKLPYFVALVLAITVHEFSHGFVATLFGDDLPRRVGRLTLNPLKHLDPIGTLLILVGPIGWGRPMPINPAAMRNPNLGWALSSLAGPVSNILVATVAAALYALIAGQADPTIFRYVATFIGVNILLAVFNLVPVPPLDGFGFIFGLAPPQLKLALLPIQQYGALILLAIVFLPPLRNYLDRFIGAGLDFFVPWMEVACQCNLPIG